jgi:hypothetical protein
MKDYFIEKGKNFPAKNSRKYSLGRLFRFFKAFLR